MNIYPKTCKRLEGLDKMEEYLKKCKGVELQFFNENGIAAPFEIKESIDNLMEKYPYVKEITIHPPLSCYEIECILFKDIEIIKTQLKECVELSRKYNIKINLLYHTLWNFKLHEALTLDKIRELLKLIEGENVILLLENIFMFFENTCTVFEVAEAINHPNLKVCFDICHLYCRANIERKNVRDYAKSYLNPELCKKHIYQVHFSAALNNDGYVDKKTHGRAHESMDDLKNDFELLKEYNMTDCNFITEVSEEDYIARTDQLKELKMLEELAQK